MLDLLYFAGQLLCLAAVAYGAFLTLRNSEMFTMLGGARFGRCPRKIKSIREADEQDPHVTELGYWP